MVLDSSNNFLKLLQQKSGARFVETQSRNMTKEDGLKMILQNMTDKETIVMSERTFIHRGQVLAINSGRTHDALQGYLTEGQKVLSSEQVLKSDKVMYKLSSATGRQLTLAFKRDAGRRNCNPVGLEELRDCQSVNFISKDLMLFQIRTSGNKKSYWTYVTINEEILELPDELERILNKTARRGAGWTKVESRIVKGNICQLLLFCQSFSQDDEKEMCLEYC